MSENNHLEEEAWLRLSLTSGVGAVSILALLKEFGAPSAIFSQSIKQLEQVVRRSIAITLLDTQPDLETMQYAKHWLTQANNFLLTLDHPAYPRALLEIADPPPILYAKGNLALLQGTSIAIVGSRSATPQGCVHAEQFAQELSALDIHIVSGLAQGIDTAAHRGGLTGAGKTIAVVGTGLDRVYPASNRSLAHQIAAEGLLISEFILGSPPLQHHFPRRNRIISGLSVGCLVVEANLQSGSLITARLAGEHGREVFAVPGSIQSPQAKGCHALIKQGAKLVECTQDILDELQIATPLGESADLKTAPAESALLSALGFDPCDLETLLQRTTLDSQTLLAELLNLELQGQVMQLAGGKYQRI